MLEKKLQIKNESGLHARPASIFVNKAGEFDSEIKIVFNGKEINAKSIMGLMGLGIESGKEITLKINGKDENKAMDELSYLINEKLAEVDDDE